MCKSLATLVPVCNFNVIFVKNYTKIFYVVCKGNMPSFQCKTSFDFCTPIGEVNDLRLLFINLNVPALTLRLHCGETALV